MHQLGFAAQAFAARWYRNEPTGKKWIVVCGDTGSGKTHVSRRLHEFFRAAAFRAWEDHWGRENGRRIPTIEFMEWIEIASPEKCTNPEFDRWMWDAERASVLLLDDIGTETDQFKGGVPVARLCHMLNRLENRFLWMTTNVRPQHWKNKWDKRVEDRLLAAEIIEIHAPSYRSEVEK